MCDKICCEAYACAAAAESALSTLPFSTWELEQLSAFLNTAGDYAHSLCGQGEVLSPAQRQELGQLAEPPVGRAAVHHRLKRLEALAGEIEASWDKAEEEKHETERSIDA